MSQSSHIPEGEHGKLIGKKFVVYNTRKGANAEMSQTCGDNSEQTGRETMGDEVGKTDGNQVVKGPESQDK